MTTKTKKQTRLEQGGPLHPVSDMQLDQLKVEWVDYGSVKPNTYNPNKMTWHDRQLLKQSLLEDGWTQPIVVTPERIIIDGEQRWTTAGVSLKVDDIQEVIDKMEERDKEGHPVSQSILWRLKESKVRLEQAIKDGSLGSLAAITGNLVPITVIDLGDEAHKIISTIRHNRARGTHQIDAMAGITNDLVQLGLDLDDLESRLGMDDEEIRRFLQSTEGQTGDLEASLTSQDFSVSLDTVSIGDLPQATQDQFQKSEEANKAIKERQVILAKHENKVKREINKRIKSADADGESLTQEEKAKIVDEVEASMPPPETTVEEVKLRKFIIFALPEEIQLIEHSLGDQQAVTLLNLCKLYLAKKPALDKMIKSLNGSE